MALKRAGALVGGCLATVEGILIGLGASPFSFGRDTGLNADFGASPSRIR